MGTRYYSDRAHAMRPGAWAPGRSSFQLYAGPGVFRSDLEPYVNSAVLGAGAISIPRAREKAIVTAG